MTPRYLASFDGSIVIPLIITDAFDLAFLLRVPIVYQYIFGRFELRSMLLPPFFSFVEDIFELARILFIRFALDFIYDVVDKT